MDGFRKLIHWSSNLIHYNKLTLASATCYFQQYLRLRQVSVHMLQVSIQVEVVNLLLESNHKSLKHDPSQDWNPSLRLEYTIPA